jgi:hypothetical protein
MRISIGTSGRSVRLPDIRHVLAVILLPLTLALAGCYDVESSLELRPDGRVEAVAEIQFDREAQQVFEAIEAYARLDPRAAPFLSRGVCRALELAGAMNPAMPMQLRATEGLQQIGEKERYVCRFTADLGTADEFADRLARRSPFGPGGISSDVMTFTRIADRTYRLTLDANGLPDSQPQQAAGALTSMLAMQTGRFPDRAEVDALISKMNGASIAITQMLYRGRTVGLTVKAPRIVDGSHPYADGEMRLQSTATEFTAIMVDPESRRDARVSATLSY